MESLITITDTDELINHLTNRISHYNLMKTKLKKNLQKKIGRAWWLLHPPFPYNNQEEEERNRRQAQALIAEVNNTRFRWHNSNLLFQTQDEAPTTTTTQPEVQAPPAPPPTPAAYEYTTTYYTTTPLPTQPVAKESLGPLLEQNQTSTPGLTTYGLFPSK